MGRREVDPFGMDPVKDQEEGVPSVWLRAKLSCLDAKNFAGGLEMTNKRVDGWMNGNRRGRKAGGLRVWMVKL